MTVTVWKYPKRDEWKVIMARPQMDLISLSRTVSDILESVRCEGDDALRRYEKQFDRVVSVTGNQKPHGHASGR